MKYQFEPNPTEAAASALAETLSAKLAEGKRVLWLLSGGSSLTIATQAASKIDSDNIENLAITMTDERFVPVGSPDENWQQLLDSGFSLPGAKLYRPLNGKSRVETTANLNHWLDEELRVADYKIAIFGMGTDGHTAGIKPDSVAVTSTELAADFTGDDFERITITPTMVRQLDEAVIQISGDNKRSQLEQLLHDELDVNQQPAQILKSVPRAVIYTDVKLG